jgi:hypothetical protein
MELVIAGRLNKQIAAELGASEKTIKVHRGRVMQKLRVLSVAELVRLAEKLEGRGQVEGESIPPGSNGDPDGAGFAGQVRLPTRKYKTKVS